MHVEMMLVCKIIQTGKLAAVIEFGITSSDFTNHEARAMFERLLVVFTDRRSSGTVIGRTLAKKEFPHIAWNEVDKNVTIDHLCHEVRANRLQTMITKLMLEVSEKVEVQDVGGALQEMRSVLAEIDAIGETRNHDTSGAKGFLEVIDDYDKIKSGENTGIATWAWEPLAREAGPIAEDDYIVFYGRPKNMKTWLLLYQAANCILHQDIPTIIYTKEMTKKNLFRRLASIIAEVPYGPVRHARLPEKLELKFKGALRGLVAELERREKENLLWVLSGIDMAGKDTMSWFRAKVKRYKPRISFIDGMYLMSPENSKLVKTQERLENVSRAARNMILETGVPLLCTLQANRQAAKHEKGEMDEIAMSDAFSQDCTAAIRTIKDKKKHSETGKQTVSLVVAGSREWNLDGIRVFGEPSTDFTFCEMMDDQAIKSAKAEDNEDPEEQKRKKQHAAKMDKKKIDSLVQKLTATA